MLMARSDQRGVCVHVRLQRTKTRPRYRKGQRKRRSYCSGTPARYVIFRTLIRLGIDIRFPSLRATGARQIATGLAELERRGGKVRQHTFSPDLATDRNDRFSLLPCALVSEWVLLQYSSATK